MRAVICAGLVCWFVGSVHPTNIAAEQEKAGADPAAPKMTPLRPAAAVSDRAPRRPLKIKQIEFVKGPDKTAPVVLAVTVEAPE